MLFLCRLYSWTESKFMTRSHFMAAVPGLIISDVNFNFSCFLHNSQFCFLQVWCPTGPTVFASSGHCVLLKFGLQDTLSHKVIKNGWTLDSQLSVTQSIECYYKLPNLKNPNRWCGAGFFPTCKDFGRMFDNSFSAYALEKKKLFFFFSGD